MIDYWILIKIHLLVFQSNAQYINRTVKAEMSTILPILKNSKWFDILLSNVSTTEQYPHWSDLLPDPKSSKRRSFEKAPTKLSFDNFHIAFSLQSVHPVYLILFHSTYEICILFLILYFNVCICYHYQLSSYKFSN